MGTNGTYFIYINIEKKFWELTLSFEGSLEYKISSKVKGQQRYDW